MSRLGFPPLPGDPGGPGGGSQHTISRIDGQHAGQRLPQYMDPKGLYGQVSVLRLEAIDGTLPRNPFLLRTSVEQFIGGAIDGATPENRGQTYALRVRSKEQVNLLLTMDKLQDETKIRIVEHPTRNQVQCVVSNGDTQHMQEEQLLECLKAQGVLRVFRIKKRVNGESVNTPATVLTIRGSVVPEYISFGWNRCRTRNYYPAPMVCYRCWSFGHTRQRCQQVADICGNCSQAHLAELQQQVDNMDLDNSRTRTIRCTNRAYCERCQSDAHPISSRQCPVYAKEDAIQRIKVDQGISFPEARRMYDETHQTNRTYANIANASKDTEIEKLKAQMKRLVEESKQKAEKIKELEKLVSSNNTSGRMQLVRSHGTIEDLVALTENLKEMLQRKTKECNNLRKIYGKEITSSLQPEEEDSDCMIIPDTMFEQTPVDKTSQRKQDKLKAECPMEVGTPKGATPKRPHPTSGSDSDETAKALRKRPPNIGPPVNQGL